MFKIPFAIIEITKPLAFMMPKYYVQEVPLWKTKESLISVRKNHSDYKMISTKNIRILKIFEDGDTEEMRNYLEKLRKEML